MRCLENDEIKKRGCTYCIDVEKKRILKSHYAGAKYYANAKHCPYDECPYTELDKYESLDDYVKHSPPLRFEVPKGL